jgi:hypothetical protein
MTVSPLVIGAISIDNGALFRTICDEFSSAIHKSMNDSMLIYATLEFRFVFGWVIG